MPTVEKLYESLLQLIVETSSNLPPDVRRAMARALRSEDPGTRSAQALQVIATSIDMAAGCDGPICQDTGWPTFIVTTPSGTDQMRIDRSEEHTSELQSQFHLVCRLLLEKKKKD